MTSSPSGQVSRRRVFYIPGYDPFPPRRYRELYRKEGAEQAAISGYSLSLRPGAGGAPFGWGVEACIDGAEVSTRVEVLTWSDIVQDSMDAGLVATYAQLARTVAIYLASGTLWRLARLRKGPVIAALYPVAMLVFQLLIAVVLGVAVGNGISGLLHGAAGALVAGAVSVFAAVLVAWQVLRFFRRLDHRFFAYYLMHDYAFSARWHGAYPPELDIRMRGFAERIAAALAEDVDEVLVIGHSSGAFIAVSVLADLLRKRPGPQRAALGLLTLGQVVPMVSFLPAAQRLRADLRSLATSEDLTWIDVTAPGDGCAFALCDPVAVTGVAPENKRWPLVVSAAFTQTLSPARWRALRWRFFRLHFQYLCAFDRPGDYDFFRITAGPLTLAQRYADRAPSPSRIERAVSKHTSVAA